MSPHPSFLQLDRLALGAADPQVAAHVASCDSCRAHLGRLEQPVPLPAWVREAAETPRRPRWLRLFAPGLGLVAAAAAVLLVVQSRAVGPAYDGTKGAPTVGIYIERAGQVSLWNGVQPLRPGDRIELKVAPDGYRHLTVAGLDHQSPVQLYQGTVAPTGETTLPRSFRLDDSPGDEQLLVLFSDAPVTGAELREVFAHPPRSKSRWAVLLVLPKMAGR